MIERGPAPTRRGLRTPVSWAFVAAVLALAPVLAVVLTRAGAGYVPLGDEANIALRVRDVFGGDLPLVGAYSRGFNHPGPLLFWLLAPLSELFGGASWTTLVGGALLQGVAIAVSAWVAFRRGGVLLTLLVLAALGLGYSAFSLGTPFLQAWNPSVAFPYFVLFLLLAWAVASGSRWSVVGVGVIATLLAQLHIGYLPIVVAVGGWVLVVVLIDARATRGDGSSGGPRGARWWRVLGLLAVALVLLWLAPVVQQLAHDPGNLTEVAEHVGDGDAVGLHRAAGIVAAEFALPPPWLGGEDHFVFGTTAVVPASTAWLVVPALALALGYLAAARSGRVVDRRLVELATVTLVASVLAIAAVTVDPSPFLFYWRVVAALLVLVAAAWAAAGWIQLDRRPRVQRAVGAGLLVVVAVSFGVRVVDVVRHRDSIDRTDTEAAALFEQLEDVPERGSVVLVRGLGSTTHGLAQGLVDELDRRSVAVRVDPEYGFQFGESRVARRDEADEIWYVTHEGRHRVLLGQDGGRVIGSVSGLGRRDEEAARAVQRSLAAALVAAGRSDLLDTLDSPFVDAALDEVPLTGRAHADVARLAELNARVVRRDTCRCLVLAFPASTAPELPYSMGY